MTGAILPRDGSATDPASCADAASVVTFNRLGRTSNILNEINEQFVALAGSATLPVLDIGCATGVVALAALEAGARVIANDVSAGHLAALAAAVPPPWEPRLTLDRRRFPDQLDFAAGSLAHVHASNLLNFLTGDEIDRGFDRIAGWLADGGMFLSMSGTPYARNVAPFIPDYEARRATGERWPGYCTAIHTLSDDPTLRELPPALHLLDPEVLARSATAAGLTVIEARFFHRRATPSYIAWDGRENVILIARKDPA